MSVYDENAFSQRVAYAKRCILAGTTEGRSFDTCFEMGDGSFVMVRLWQEAIKNPVLAERLKGYGTDKARFYFTVYSHKKPAEIGRLAAIARRSGRGN